MSCMFWLSIAMHQTTPKQSGLKHNLLFSSSHWGYFMQLQSEVDWSCGPLCGMSKRAHSHGWQLTQAVVRDLRLGYCLPCLQVASPCGLGFSQLGSCTRICFKSHMVRCADMEMIVREEEAYIYSRALETGSIACHAGPHEETLGWERRRKKGRGEHSTLLGLL